MKLPCHCTHRWNIFHGVPHNHDVSLLLTIPGTSSARGIKHPLPQRFRAFQVDVTPLIAMASYSDVLDESTLALLSEIDQAHRNMVPQDLTKYVNSLMSLGRHVQLYKSSDHGSTTSAACP